MATLVCFHAHPDDESITTGGSMARASAEGHRVVLVVATRGERGEVAEGILSDGETLGERREAETRASAAVLGVARVEFLGYVDSGMMGDDSNTDPDCFWQADVGEAAGRLAAILRDESADVITVYDDHGNYGHPDHIQVHRVGVRAAALAGVDRVLEATMNRDALIAQITEGAARFGADLPDGVELPNPADFAAMGTPAAGVTHALAVEEWTDAKRASMRCHSSQIAESSFFLQLPDDAFRSSFGTEWFIERGVPRGDGEPFRRELFAS